MFQDGRGIVKVLSCIQKDGIPKDEDGVHCHPDNLQIVSNILEDEGEEEQGLDGRTKLYFPYPEPGSWYITLQAQCFETSDDNR